MSLTQRDMIPVMVDCTKQDRGGQRKPLMERYKVTGYPTVVVLDPDGQMLGHLPTSAPDTIPQQLANVVKRVKADEAARAQQARGPGPAVEEPKEKKKKEKPPARKLVEPQRGAPIEPVETTLEDGLAQAKERGRFLAVLFTATPELAPETAQLLESLRSPELSSLPEKFLWILRPLTDERGDPTPEAEAHRASKSPTLVLFDPWADPPRDETAPFPSAVTVKPKDDLRTKIERMVLDAARAGHPPPPPKRAR